MIKKEQEFLESIELSRKEILEGKGDLIKSGEFEDYIKSLSYEE